MKATNNYRFGITKVYITRTYEMVASNSQKTIDFNGVEIGKGDIWDTYAHQTLNIDKSPLSQRSSGIKLSHFYHHFKYRKKQNIIALKRLSRILKGAWSMQIYVTC